MKGETINDLKQLGSFAEPEFLDEKEDYVSIAENKMRKIGRVDKSSNRGKFGALTTTKIRGILSLVNKIYNEVITEQSDELSDVIVNEIRYLKVRMIYEAGRDSSKFKDIQKFFETTEIIKAIDHIQTSRKKFFRYANYLEALVAYHRFFGGKDH
ncbi:MAG TPA: type III-A CRISPR-associated protein Csm2 [Ruminiclostridium sp.]|nr:type III-A CRISPR-associated protein Csm2 [Ruminiclostridium sp.]